jgi:biotin-dependent carboxylase-like uncharacterized protein
MSVHVLAPGLRTTVQDLGRVGWRHLGVGGAGALDPQAHAIANLLVGNDVGAATLEITLAGPRLRFEQATCIALCGATIDARVGDRAVPGWRPVWLPADSVLELGACRDGARTWLAVAGGFAVDPVLGSASTDLRGGFGGHAGRALAVGDVLDTGPAARTVDALHIASWWLAPEPAPSPSPATIRVLPGRDAPLPEDGLFAREWRVAAASDRQGLRLEGEPLPPRYARERISAPVAPGTVQLPPDGRPIVLLADAQSHGGYPHLGHAIHADLGRLAQLRPGDAVRFVACSAAEARRARRAQAHTLARIALAITARRQRDH